MWLRWGGEEVMKRKGTLGTLRLSARLKLGGRRLNTTWGLGSAPGDKGEDLVYKAGRWGEDGNWRVEGSQP